MKIRELNTNEIIGAYQKLHDHFPENEIRKLKHVIPLLREELYIGYGLFIESTCIAYALLAKTKISNYLLLDYFAVNEEFRNKQFGSILLAHISKGNGEFNGIVVEVESLESAKNISETDERKRRIEFYKRNHFTDTNLKSMVYGVEYALMILQLNGNQRKEDILNGLNEIYQILFSSTIPNKHVKLLL